LQGYANFKFSARKKKGGCGVSVERGWLKKYPPGLSVVDYHPAACSVAGGYCPRLSVVAAVEILAQLGELRSHAAAVALLAASPHL